MKRYPYGYIPTRTRRVFGFTLREIGSAALQALGFVLGTFVIFLFLVICMAA